jgi:hypothetical protein
VEFHHGEIPGSRSEIVERKDLHALQRQKRNARDQVQEMRVPEPPPQEQGAEGLIPVAARVHPCKNIFFL